MINIRWQHIAILALTSWLVACSTPTQLSAPHPDLQAAATPSIASRVVSDGIGSECNLPPDSSRPQYIIGYGSLMQDESRKRSSPQAGPAHPVDVRGYRRGWFARTEAVGFGTTYLGVLPNRESHLNAVIYRVEATEVIATDRREVSYCRTGVAMSAIKPFEREFLLAARWTDLDLCQRAAECRNTRFALSHCAIVCGYFSIGLPGAGAALRPYGVLTAMSIHDSRLVRALGQRSYLSPPSFYLSAESKSNR